MPLPNLSKRCIARCRSRGGARCWNPAAYGCATCRYHGAKPRETVRAGEQHWNYRHGEATKSAKAASTEGLRELRKLEARLKKMKVL